jgi:hypothetical protein
MLDALWRSVVIGIGGTALLDIWAIMLNRIFGLAPPNWAMVGRWFWHLQYGKVFHEDIGKAEPYVHELTLGWIGHYAVGILYGLILVIFAGVGWLAAPTFIPAWIVGLVTVGAGWFLLQPGGHWLGGFEIAQCHAGSSTEPYWPHRVRIRSLWHGAAHPVVR